ncbi:thrombospondin type 3 repeat-containing protein [Pyxidicoccus caerfyrddinensis]|uniref:thrombospondin type 3 repeat-containing protein n=1 Tax=Pyxidicoccus caerfyrddinensis TaxID=2709663 RepID=UPI001967AA26|nr:thrombospondin type 3 repeat-containing protein [Pyxidicoccus caerfyrddinensis]
MGSLVLFAASPAEAVCKLVINVDRTGSMMSTRADGQTKCQVSQNSVLLILEGYWQGLDFNISNPGLGFTTRVEYDTNCPAGPNYQATASTRLVQVREFQGDVMQPLWVGFKPVNEAIQFMVNSSGWYNTSTGVSLNSCPGAATPMAQAMCRAARQFSLTPPAGESRIIKMTTDGQENHSDIVPIDAGETRCRNPGDTELTWRTRVSDEYTSRNIVSDADLWSVISDFSLRGPAPEERERVAEARGDVVGNVAPLTSLSPSPDYDFFSSLAVSTGGRFTYVESSKAISSAATQADSDNDGIPDYRDQCVGACAADGDQDGIPDANDVCPFLDEDGHAPARTDGCPDTDFDGFRNGLDQCPTIAEDLLAPYPNDGCAASSWSASGTPNLKTVDNGSACTSLSVTSTTGAASVAKLNISGTHAYRSVLRGTLAHNGTTVEAFPINTFAGGSGTFSFTNRPIAMPAGAAAGTWTLCIYDTDAFGDTGVLNTWSIHN